MIIRYIKQILIVVFFIGIYSCDKKDEQSENYGNVSEINLPTHSPRGLAFDGNHLWYSDDSLSSLFKVSDKGSILETIKLPGCKLTGFDFYDNYIWCNNDNIVLYDTSISLNPFLCIYKLSLEGEKLDSILIRTSPDPYRLELSGLTVCNSVIYGTMYIYSYSDYLFRTDFKNKKVGSLGNRLFTGLTTKNDTIYAIDKGYSKDRIGPLDSNFEIIEDRVIYTDFQATDLVFVNNDLWICDREARKLRKLKYPTY
jgi:hypothetical protein